MAYASWSVVFGEQPSAAKWNILGTNDASFNDGTGIDWANVGGTGAGVVNGSLDTTAGELGGAWQSWTPSWTNMSVSNSTVVAKYTQIGKTVHFRIKVTLAGGDKPSGSVVVSLPVTANTEQSVNTTLNITVAYLDSGTQVYPGSTIIAGSGDINLYAIAAGGTYASIASSPINATVPFTWTNGDVLSIHGTYEAA